MAPWLFGEVGTDRWLQAYSWQPSRYFFRAVPGITFFQKHIATLQVSKGRDILGIYIRERCWIKVPKEKQEIFLHKK